MTYQSLYRRYRPQRFGEVLGQEHVSTTLRNAVRTGTVAHAYLFSGPRGCGKTTSARILAKALNCTDLQDGEPCGVCDSCKQVTSGASLDVQELDAASNNGVEAMRDLVARAALGTPGRRKVYIVDEVHMLSTAASNALLKTLEEPPEHVVFVLATTDPQKVLPTIRSRTQHFEFRLFPQSTLVHLLRGVADDAGLDVDDATIEAVARRGNGSARDALTALDQVVASGHVADTFDVGALAAALAAHDAAALLVAVDSASQLGRDPRQVARDLVEALREAFLAHMGVGDRRADAGLAVALGPAALTRAMDVLGEALVTMREAVDPRVTLEVALVRLVRADLDPSPAAILERLERLERGSQGATRPPRAPADASSPAQAAEQSPSRGPAVSTDLAPPRAQHAPSRGASASLPPLAPPPPDASAAAPRGPGAADEARAVLTRPKAGSRSVASPASQMAAQEAPRVPSPSADVGPIVLSVDALRGAQEDILDRLERVDRRARALFAAGRFISAGSGRVAYGLPNAMHLDRCRDVAPSFERVLREVTSSQAALELVVDDQGSVPMPPDPEGASAGMRLPPVQQAATVADEDIDLTELTDAPAADAQSALDRLTRAFPGAEVVDDAAGR